MPSNPLLARLQQRRSELQTRAERIGADLRGPATPIEGGFADQATAHANDTVLEGIRESAEAELQQIDKALRRIADGRHEHCEICGGPITKERLEAVPYATTCIGCAA